MAIRDKIRVQIWKKRNILRRLWKEFDPLSTSAINSIYCTKIMYMHIDFLRLDYIYKEEEQNIIEKGIYPHWVNR